MGEHFKNFAVMYVAVAEKSRQKIRVGVVAWSGRHGQGEYFIKVHSRSHSHVPQVLVFK